MQQELLENHLTDAKGLPMGGNTDGLGISIKWQNGPLGHGESRKDPNGAFVETVIGAAIGRLEFYQDTKFACSYNAMAILHLGIALEHLKTRTADRTARQVEGTHEK